MGRYDWAICLGVAFAAAAVFAPSCRNGFINFDDPDYVYENPHVLGGLTPENVKWAFTTTHAAFWMPLTWLSLQLDATLFGPGPEGFHGTNVFLHAVNAAMVFLTFRRLTGRPGPCAVLALLFAIHPLRVESVTWVTERKDVLSGFCWWCAALAYTRYAASPSLGRMALVAAFYGVGLAAKPMVITLPFALLLLDYWPLGRVRDRLDVARLLQEKWPLFALTAAAVVETVFAQKEAISDLGEVSLASRLSNALTGYGMYLLNTVYPVDLAALYPLFPAEPRPAWQPAASAVGLLVLSVGAYRLRRRAPYLLVGWLWFLGVLFPVSGILQAGQQAYADRFTYLPHVGLLLAIVWGVADLTARYQVPGKAAAAATAVVATIAAALTVHQIAYWKDTVALFDHSVAVTGPNGVASYILATEQLLRGNTAEALRHYSDTCRVKPDHAAAFAMRALLLHRAGRSPEAEHDAERSLTLLRKESTPDAKSLNIALFILAEARHRQGKWSEAEALYREALRYADEWEVRYNLGTLLARVGRLDEAIDQLGAAATLSPDNPRVQFTLGTALSDRGDWERAASALGHAASLSPQNARMRGALAVALLESGRASEAARQAREAARLDPAWMPGSTRAAWVLATHSDPSRRRAQSALRLCKVVALASDVPSAELLDAQSAAEAACNRFEEAARVAEQAASVAERAGRSDLATAIRKRRDLYQARQTYTEPPAGR